MSSIRSSYLFLLLYILFIIYGSLFPLVDWRLPPQDLLQVWKLSVGTRVSRSDLITNILAYFPLGFLLSASFSNRLGYLGRILLTVILGSLLSFSMEYLQLFLPARTSSPVDLLLNMLSTLFGALSWNWLGIESSFGERLRVWRHNWFIDGRVANIGLSVIALWGATQLAPFVPSLDIGGLKNGLKPIWLTLHDLSRFNSYRAVMYALNISSLGSVLLLTLKLRDRVLVWQGLSCGLVLLGKITIVGRQLSLEALVGILSAVLLTIGIQRLPRSRLIFVGICSVVVAYIVDELRPEISQSGILHDFNWVPFQSQMTENVSGSVSIIDGIWPFAAIGFFAVAYASSGRKIHALSTGVFLAIGVFALEYLQSFIVGRYPDITPVILAIVGWSIPLLVFMES